MVDVRWSPGDTYAEVADRLGLIMTRLPHQIYREAFILVSWEIWNCRNDRSFNNVIPSVHSWFAKFSVSLKTQSCRFSVGAKEALRVWLVSLASVP